MTKTGMEERNGLDDYWLGAVCCAHYPSFMEDVLHAKGVARRRKVLRRYAKTMQECASGVLKGGSGLELEGSVDMEQVKALRECDTDLLVKRLARHYSRNFFYEFVLY